MLLSRSRSRGGGQVIKRAAYFSFVLFILLSGWIQGQSKLNIHGYLTQAYAVTDGNKIFGIPSCGTMDYRTLALQFRYDANPVNTMVIQFSHERIGTCPIMALKQDVEVDWAFFEHRFGDATSVKIGKIQIPLGIYNEIRDVGVLLPFYRLPYSPYGEGNYINETVNGLAFSHTLELLSDWELELNLYGGQWTWPEWYTFFNPFSGSLVTQAAEANIENGIGTQLWLNCPLEGLRFGLNGQRGHASGGILFQPDGWLGERDFNSLIFSVDATFHRFFVRSEYARCAFSGIDFAILLGYLQTGFNITEHIALNLQYEGAHGANIPTTSVTAFSNWGTRDRELNRDYSFGLNYNFNAENIVRFESHWNHGFLVENKAVSLSTGFPSYTRYIILSFSTCF